MTEWYEDEFFWRMARDILFGSRRQESTLTEVNQILKLANIRTGSRILDLCCGPGRHSLELARRGYKVMGVDFSYSYLEEARKKAHLDRLNVEFIQEDMRRFQRPDHFELVINLFTSFGYFEDQKENLKVLENIYNSLVPDGKLILELMGKEILARDFQERAWLKENGVILLEDRTIFKNWSWIENHWTILKGNERNEFLISHQIYSASELIAMLRQQGFSNIEVFGDYEGSTYDQHAKRLVVIGNKPI